MNKKKVLPIDFGGTFVIVKNLQVCYTTLSYGQLLQIEMEKLYESVCKKK